MKISHWALLAIFLLMLGCRAQTGTPVAELNLTATETEPPVLATVTPNLPPPTITPTPIPEPDFFARVYLDAWKEDDYAAMYAMLTTISKDAISLEDFEARYRKILAEAAIESIDYEILALLKNEQSAEVSYSVTLNSVLVGEIRRETVMNLTLEAGTWQVQWDDALILPELAGGNYLWMDRQIPSRANIYDRFGNPVVAFAEAVSIGIIPGQFPAGEEGRILSDIQAMTGIPAGAISYQYRDYPPGADWLVYVGEVPFEKAARYFDVANGYSYNGLIMYPFESRFYFNNGIAPQTIGYVSFIQAEEEEEYLRLGFNRDEKIGRQGIEKWGDPYLSGKRGGTLYVIGPDNQVVTQLADVAALPSQAIYTTIEADLQLAIQTMLKKYYGAVVVIEVDTGRVLAMGSSPAFDPNAFEPNNANSSYQLQDIYDAFNGQPLYNRATRGQYPLGSVFKIITMAAALESGLFERSTIYDCQYHFTEIQGIPPRHDWTWTHCQDELAENGECETMPSGELTLVEGLMRSCNPYFWHIGLELHRQGLVDGVSEMARGFGLGSKTGIVGVEEEAGNMPTPNEEVAAINQAIGQGDVLVTPLQVAQFIAAIGNGGTLYQPQLIEKIAPPDGDPVFEFEPIITGELPISPETLEALQLGMVSVVQDRRGTAYHVLGAFSQNLYAAAGKTGTAESSLEESHAWFAGYTRENRENRPDIAVVVIQEHAGEGSEVAAPIFRAVVQQYFEGRRSYLFPWETSVGVLSIPEDELPAETEGETP